MSVLTISRFQLPARTAEAAIEGDTIVGRFGKSPLVITNAVRLSEEFANLPDTPVHILRFTKKFAPLMHHAKPDDKFRFELSEWLGWRKAFRNSWTEVATPPPTERIVKEWLFPKGSRLLWSGQESALQQERFLQLINLCFGGLSLDRIRICPAAECKTPFFVAADRRDVSCGEQACIDWVIRRVKRTYWSKHGPRILAERKRKREE